MEKRGVPTSTIVTTAFITPARLAAKNLQIDALPVIVTPHPLNDLKPDEVMNLARSVYPMIVMQLTSQQQLAPTVHADFVHPVKAKTRLAEPADAQKGAL